MSLNGGNREVALSVDELARCVRERECTAEVVTEEVLSRIEKVESEVCAFQSTSDRILRRAARRVDTDPSGLALAGVPVAVKDCFDVAGFPTRFGSEATCEDPVSSDDPAVARLRSAGALIVGKTTMSAWCVSPVTRSAISRDTNNPVFPDWTVGGSSGGSAAAVAAGMAMVALGSDSAGSTRFPAACNGLVGLKTSPGIVPSSGNPRNHDWFGLDSMGVLARTPEDVATVLSVLAPDIRSANPVPPMGLRIGWLRTPPPSAHVSWATQDAIRVGAQRLTACGHFIAPLGWPFGSGVMRQVGRRFVAGVAAQTKGLDLANDEPYVRGAVTRGRLIVPKPSRTTLARTRRRFRTRYRDYDAFILPVIGMNPPRLPHRPYESFGKTVRWATQIVAFTAPWNLLGYAAVAVPVGIASDGSPLSIQIAGPPGSEFRLLGLARQVLGGSLEGGAE